MPKDDLYFNFLRLLANLNEKSLMRLGLLGGLARIALARVREAGELLLLQLQVDLHQSIDPYEDVQSVLLAILLVEVDLDLVDLRILTEFGCVDVLPLQRVFLEGPLHILQQLCLL